tara:strand:- start:369 stop:635 length:267 start_codon:yes stop_codon:yes gene_type:complete
MSDEVFKPEHYTRCEIDPVDFIMKNDFEFWRGNIIKYASRAGYKQYSNKNYVESEIIDLQKIIRYAEIRIEQLHFDHYCGIKEGYKDA